MTYYFDNAATTFPKPEEVYRFMDSFYRSCGVNVGRGQYSLAAKASNLVEETRRILLSIFGCPNKKVIFTSSATEALNIILQGIICSNGMTIYVTPFEHNSVTRVLHCLSKKYRLNIITLAVNKENLQYDLKKIQNQFTEKKPDVTIINHASNVCGVIAPANQIAALAKRHQSITVVDMCQSAGLVDIVLNDDTIDFAVFAGHKTLYGPLGIGGFICSPAIKPLPLLFGGTGIDSANQDLPETIPERYEVGSPNIMAISGFHAALQWLNNTGLDMIRDREQINHRRLLTLLESYKNITVIAPRNINESVGVVSCVFDGYSSDDIGKVLNEWGIAVRSGLHCSPYAHQFLGTAPSGTVRFSVSYFNDENDFQILRNALSYIYENS
jgi:cysteine desulfurase family protein